MKKILLADDSITIQKVVELTFSDADYQVISVSNGAQALKKIAEVRPNVVLLDVIMPEKNGYEVCEQIKRSPATAGIPVLLLTGTFEPFDRKRAELAGADGHLTKPFESQVLVAKVEELIARTPMVVSNEEAGAMDIISGGDFYRVEHGADRLRTAPGTRAAATSSPQPGPAIPPPPVPFPPTENEAAIEEPGGAKATHPALAPPDPAAGGAYIGFADVTRSDEEGAIIPDRFSEPTGGSPSTMRLRRDALVPPAERPSSGPVPGGAGAAGTTSGIFTGAFESEFQLSEDDVVAAVGSPEGESADVTWTPPPEAPPAETWQSVEPDEGVAAPHPAPPSTAPAAAPLPHSSTGAPTAGLTPEAIDLIAEKVVQRLSDRIVREIAWEVVPSVAEAVVRRRIQELEEKDPT